MMPCTCSTRARNASTNALLEYCAGTKGTTTFDMIVEVLEGGCVGAPVTGACDDDLQPTQVLCSSMTPTLQGEAAGDGLWFVLVDGFEAGDKGSYGLRVDTTP